MSQLLMFENEFTGSLSISPCSASSVKLRKGVLPVSTQKQDFHKLNIVSRDLKFDEICNRTDAISLESELRSQKYLHIAGVDEAGRGPLAGPVVACACILPSNFPFFHEMTDSKKLSQAQREKLFLLLTSHPEVQYAVGVVSHEEIDRINILQATFKAMRMSVSQLSIKPSCILIDGDKSPPGLAEKYATYTVIKGDALCPSISAASIIAKVTRDKIVDEYDLLWPHYKFKKHKGYCTKLHISILKEYGPLPVHRKTFKPISEMHSSFALTLF